MHATSPALAAWLKATLQAWLGDWTHLVMAVIPIAACAFWFWLDGRGGVDPFQADTASKGSQ